LNRLKQRFVYASLIVLAVWPAGHIALVTRYGVNPWKLAGWGMYSAPQIVPEVRLFGLTSDAVRRYELGTVPTPLAPAVLDFRRARLGLGELARPDSLAKAMLDHYSAIDGVAIVVVQPVLDPASGMIEDRSTTYEYER
jgi:hypothetical protein